MSWNNTVLIDRRTKWGNPFRIRPDGSREEVIARYRADLWRRIRAGEIALEELAEIAGFWYACWCYRANTAVMARCWPAPRPGHPTVLAEREARPTAASAS